MCCLLLLRCRRLTLLQCDESGPPCKSCAALEIPCTFERPSRRRGPPNRHAEAIKRQKLENESYDVSAESPTRDAAYSLASLSTPVPLSAESICDLVTLENLIDDYFIYIHPLVPVPHEPSFREAFARREDRTDRTFLAMLAVMIEASVASFPRRARQVFSSEQAKKQFPNAGVLMDKCHQVFAEARGLGFLDHELNIMDACSSYLAGLSAAYTFDVQRMALYYSECVMTLRALGFHTAAGPVKTAIVGYGQTTSIQSQLAPNYIYQECGRRLFWLCFVGAMSMRQLDDTGGDILMPPMSHADGMPPMPLEIDDEYITESVVYGQPPGVVSEITGFNLNIKVFRAFHQLAALEMAFGSDTIHDIDRQRQVIRRALHNVKIATQDAPQELQLNPVNDYGEWPPTSYDTSAYSQVLAGPPKRAVQFEIQKANIYGSQLASRSYLVEKFWNLAEILDQTKTSPPTLFVRRDSGMSPPTVGVMASGVESRHPPPRSAGTHSDSQMDVGEQAMAVEREDIVRDLAVLLRSINQVNMEPNGLSFVSNTQLNMHEVPD